jgi:hypothetical protein
MTQLGTHATQIGTHSAHKLYYTFHTILKTLVLTEMSDKTRNELQTYIIASGYILSIYDSIFLLQNTRSNTSQQEKRL